MPLPKDLGQIIKEKSTSSELILGVRPEDLSLSKRKNPDSLGQVDVYVTEPLGSEIIVDFMLGGSMLKARTPPDFIVHPGDKVYIAINKERMHIFDKKTEKAII